MASFIPIVLAIPFLHTFMSTKINILYMCLMCICILYVPPLDAHINIDSDVNYREASIEFHHLKSKFSKSRFRSSAETCKAKIDDSERAKEDRDQSCNVKRQDISDILAELQGRYMPSGSRKDVRGQLHLVSIYRFQYEQNSNV